jgi:hypothetical protein
MRFLRIVRAVLREIFEEAAYERFCVREQLQAGTRSYAKFLAEDTQRENRRVRCC